MMSTNIFYEAARAIMGMVEGQYDVMAGHWPENYDEIVLVLTPGGSVSDFMLYSHGFARPCRAREHGARLRQRRGRQ